MKRTMLLGICAFLLLTGVSTAWGESMSVTVREAELRSAPQFLSRIVGTAVYGDRLEVVEKRDPWFRLTAPDGTAGWVHSSALTSKEIVLTASEADVRQGASADEVALAGRGFNERVENEFKEESDVDYSGIDRMESEYRIDPGTLLSFLEEGGLGTGGGK